MVHPLKKGSSIKAEIDRLRINVICGARVMELKPDAISMRGGNAQIMPPLTAGSQDPG